MANENTTEVEPTTSESTPEEQAVEQQKKARQARSQKVKGALAKTKAKKVKAKSKGGNGPRHCIDSVTLSMIHRAEGATLAEIHQTVVKAFPGHNRETLLHTTRRRLHGYLQDKHGITIVKDDNGRYRVKTAKKATAGV